MLWYKLRVENTLSNILEEWMRSGTPSSQNRALQEYYLDLLHGLTEEMRQQPFFGSAFQAYQKKDKSPTLDFSLIPDDSDRCDLNPRSTSQTAPDPEWLKANSGYTMLVNMRIFVDRAMNQPDFDSSHYAIEAEKYLKELNTVDLICLREIYPNDDVAINIDNFHADVLRLNARWLLIGLSNSQKVRASDEVNATLKKALQAAREGRILVSQDKDRVISSRRQADKPFSEKISAEPSLKPMMSSWRWRSYSPQAFKSDSLSGLRHRIELAARAAYPQPTAASTIVHKTKARILWLSTKSGTLYRAIARMKQA